MKRISKTLCAVFALFVLVVFAGCSVVTSGTDTPKYAIGDIVLNDGTKVSYDVAKDYTNGSQELTDLQAKAVAVIFKADTKSTPALGVGIKHEKNSLEWCKDNNVKGYNTYFTETVCAPDEGTNAGSRTFKNSPYTDGSKNLSKMIAKLTKESTNDTGVTCNADGTINFASSIQETLKTNYPAFEFAYYYGKNEGHNIVPGSIYETGWYLPSTSELNDIYQVNKPDSVFYNALEVIGGNSFNASSYWSSSQCSTITYAYAFDFQSGNTYAYYNTKNAKHYVCAIRAFN